MTFRIFILNIVHFNFLPSIDITYQLKENNISISNQFSFTNKTRLNIDTMLTEFLRIQE